jgi:hypothetical protein
MHLDVVFVRELESPDQKRLLGKFAAELKRDVWSVLESVEGLSVEDAIAWGRERAGIVLVAFGRREGHLWSAGATPHWSYEPWPPPDLPPLLPRPVPEPGWQSRASTAEPIAWSITSWLEPEDFDARARSPDGLDEALEAWDQAVAAAAAPGRLHWDRRPMDGFLADLQRTSRAGGDVSTVTTRSSPTYRITLVETSATASGADAQARARLRLPTGFRATLGVHPADLP